MTAQDTRRWAGNGTGRQRMDAANPIVPTRSFVLAAIAKADGANLFGGAVLALFEPKYVPEGIEITDGNVATFLAPRVAVCEVEGITVPTAAKLDDAVADWAHQLLTATRDGDKDPAQLHRICLEYAISSCLRKPGEMDSFAGYREDARNYRAAVKLLKAAADNSTNEVFGDPREHIATVIERNMHGMNAWGGIAALIAKNPHVATLRTAVAAPPLYASIDAWKEMAAVEATARPAVLGEVYAIIAKSGNPVVTMETVRVATARAKGNLLLTEGNPYGVKLGTIVKATGTTPVTRVTRNGGKRVEVTGDPAAIGAAFSGLQGVATGVIEADDHRLTFGFTVEDGKAGKAPVMIVVPTSMSIARPQATF